VPLHHSSEEAKPEEEELEVAWTETRLLVVGRWRRLLKL
jgi:hypothetical protein